PGEYGNRGVDFDARDASTESKPEGSLAIGIGSQDAISLQPGILVNDAAEAAVVFEDHGAAPEGREAEAPVGERSGRVELILLEVAVRLAGKRGDFLAIIDRERCVPRRDQNAPVVVGMQKQLTGILVGGAA